MLPPCRRCGRTDPQRMIALMTPWFGRFIEAPPDHGYFYLCPSCDAEIIGPALERERQKLEEMYPRLRGARRLREEEAARESAEGEEPTRQEEAGDPPDAEEKAR